MNKETNILLFHSDITEKKKVNLKYMSETDIVNYKWQRRGKIKKIKKKRKKES